MRTTLTLDADVAARLKEAARDRPFRVVVNEALRAGLAALDRPTASSRPFRTRGFNLGPSLVGSLDNIEEVIARVDGEAHR